MIDFSNKQKEVWRNTIQKYHRWNVSYGATRSGKTYLDYYKIPYRIRNADKTGLILLLGNTKGTLERNILDPLRQIWTDSLVGYIGSNNKVRLFGRECYALGADKINQVSKLQGSGLAYCYGDEVTTWHPDLFQMLKSRLDKPTSCFDGTCNPDNPNHWFRKFLDGNADIYSMKFTIDDNPFLTKDFVENLKREYLGTIYYDRFILGNWAVAEGLIYRQFADNPDKYRIKVDKEHLKDVNFVSIGIDFGGTRSLTTFVATAIHNNYKKITILKDYNIQGEKGDIDADRLCNEFVGFIQRLKTQYPYLYIKYVFADSEAQYLINSLRKTITVNNLGFGIGDSAKRPIIERIIATNTLLNTGKMFLSQECNLVADGLANAVWEDKKTDTRLDNFSSDIDILDGFEYSFERFIKQMCPLIINKR